MNAFDIFILGIIIAILCGAALLIICKKANVHKLKEELSRGIRIVIDSGDSDSFYQIMEIIKIYKPWILGAQYNDTIADTITMNLIVKEERFQTVFSKVNENENAEVSEVEIMEELT